MSHYLNTGQLHRLARYWPAYTASTAHATPQSYYLTLRVNQNFSDLVIPKNVDHAQPASI